MDSRGSRLLRRLLQLRKVCKLKKQPLVAAATFADDAQLASLLFADVRQRLGKRRYSPDRGRSPSPSPTREVPPVREKGRGVHRRLGVASQDSRGFFSSSSKDRKKSKSVVVDDFSWWHEHCVLGLTCRPALRLLQATCGAAWAQATTRAARVRSASRATARQGSTRHRRRHRRPPPREDEATERREGRWRRRRTTPRCRRCGAQ